VSSAIQAPINPPLPNPTLPVAGIDLDPALNKNLQFANYGDPRSKTTTDSKGPGDGGAFGTGSGLGLGEGKGPGFGPGENGNIGGESKAPGCCGGGGAKGNNPNPDDVDRVFTPPQVTQRPRVTFKPEPQYSEEARKSDITGSVILSVVFSRTGEVTNIRAIKGLPGGLTERAMAAARRIQFVPGTREGHPVNVHMQLEYNFNLY
jgi:periplasmic protein TonB